MHKEDVFELVCLGIVGVLGTVIVVGGGALLLTWPLALWWHLGYPFWPALSLTVVWLAAIL